MKITLTGATGFVGRALVKALPQGQIVALVRDVGRAQALLGPNVTCVAIADSEAVHEAITDAKAVINLAGEPIMGGPTQRFGTAHRAAMESSRIGTTSMLVSALGAIAPARRPQVLVSASAIGFYGDSGDVELDETSPNGTGILADLGVRWEASALAAQDLGVRVVTPRLGVVLGHDGGALGRLLPIFRAGIGGPWGSGKQFMSWIHLQDLVAMLAWAVKDDRVQGAINATAPAPVTVKSFARALGKALHRPAFIPAPTAALRLAFGAAADTLLHSQRVLPKAAIALGFEFRYPTLEAALADLVGF